MSYTMGDFIHMLLIIAIVVFLLRVVKGLLYLRLFGQVNLQRAKKPI